MMSDTDETTDDQFVSNEQHFYPDNEADDVLNTETFGEAESVDWETEHEKLTCYADDIFPRPTESGPEATKHHGSFDQSQDSDQQQSKLTLFGEDYNEDDLRTIDLPDFQWFFEAHKAQNDNRTGNNHIHGAESGGANNDPVNLEESLNRLVVDDEEELDDPAIINVSKRPPPSRALPPPHYFPYPSYGADRLLTAGGDIWGAGNTAAHSTQLGNQQVASSAATVVQSLMDKLMQSSKSSPVPTDANLLPPSAPTVESIEKQMLNPQGFVSATALQQQAHALNIQHRIIQELQQMAVADPKTQQNLLQRQQLLMGQLARSMGLSSANQLSYPFLLQLHRIKLLQQQQQQSQVPPAPGPLLGLPVQVQTSGQGVPVNPVLVNRLSPVPARFPAGQQPHLQRYLSNLTPDQARQMLHTLAASQSSMGGQAVPPRGPVPNPVSASAIAAQQYMAQLHQQHLHRMQQQQIHAEQINSPAQQHQRGLIPNEGDEHYPRHPPHLYDRHGYQQHRESAGGESGEADGQFEEDEEEEEEAMEEVDPNEGGWMTQNEKDWLVKVQTRQLQCENPYIQDYYYTVRRLKEAESRWKLARSRNLPHGPHPICSLPPPVTADSRAGSGLSGEGSSLLPSGGGSGSELMSQYKPVQFENSLGRLTTSSVYAPRQVIDLPTSVSRHNQTGELRSRDFPQSELDPETVRNRKYMELLHKIENLYNKALYLDEVEKSLAKIVAYNVPLRGLLETRRKVTIGRLMPNLLGDTAFFTDLFTVAKGRRLLARLLTCLDSASVEACLHAFIVNFAEVREKCTPKMMEDMSVLYAGLSSSINSLDRDGACRLLDLCWTRQSGREETSEGSQTGVASLAVPLCSDKLGFSFLTRLLDRYATQCQPSDADDFRRQGITLTNILVTLPETLLHVPFDPNPSLAELVVGFAGSHCPNTDGLRRFYTLLSSSSGTDTSSTERAGPAPVDNQG